ncbi:MAG: hypothetical protein ACFE9N_17225 [Promethearchaeota archaeon]
MKNKDNTYNHREKFEKDKKEHLENVNNGSSLKTDYDFCEKDDSYLDLSKLFDETFKDFKKDYTKNKITYSDSINGLFKLSENELTMETNTLTPEISNNIENVEEKKNGILKEKIDEYNDKYQILEKKIIEFEEKTSELIKKREEYEDSINKYKEKNKTLDERNEEISNQLNKLKEAREKITEISKQIEEKKIELEKRDDNLKKSEKNLEKIRFELEKNKLELEKNKLEFEIGKSNLETKIEESHLDNVIRTSEESEQIFDEVKERKKGKGEILQNLMLELSHTGNFKSCLLIDGKGMLISEYSQIHLDSIAIGAMFSLICTTILRAVKTLNLYDLDYFKMSSINGEFIIKNINLINYERNFILLAYYDDSNSTIQDTKQILNKKIINRILKNVKKDFNKLGEGSKNSEIFDNLNERIEFLKKKYTIPQEELESTRVNLLNETSVKIKDLFEN